MPIYEFVCRECGKKHEVLTDYETGKWLELLCVHCGGVVKAASVNIFSTVTSKRAEQATSPPKAKTCGHTHHCRCAAIKQTRPNPFQEQIDKALGGAEHE